MSHYIIPGGAFERAFEQMPAECHLPWTCGIDDEARGDKKAKKAKKEAEGQEGEEGSGAQGQVQLPGLRAQRLG